jgi:hypothetical protein
MLTNFVSNYDDLRSTRIGNMIKGVENIDLLVTSENKGIIQKIAYYLNLSNPLEWIFLAIFSLVVSSKYPITL